MLLATNCASNTGTKPVLGGRTTQSASRACQTRKNGPLAELTFLLIALFAILAAVSQVVRYVRSRGVERLQIKWFAFAVISVFALMLVEGALRDVLPFPTLVWDLLLGSWRFPHCQSPSAHR